MGAIAKTLTAKARVDMDALETFEHAGMICELHRDDDEAMSPAEWDTLGTLYALDRSAEYVGFQDHSETHGQAIEASEKSGAVLVRYLRLCHGVIALPVRVEDYGSSGIRLYESDEPNAYIATTHERVSELCGVGAKYHTREWIKEALRGELATWVDYFEGNVVGYVVRDPSGVVVDSCWGFYPSYDAPTEKATDSYRAAWEELDTWLRPYAEALARAFDAAEYEAAERERAANQEVPTR